jgi:hypothetical protein
MARMRHTRRDGATLGKVRSMLSLAESDPARFRAECAAAASKLGVGVEQVYQLLQDREQLKNVALSGAVKLARRALGL